MVSVLTASAHVRPGAIAAFAACLTHVFIAYVPQLLLTYFATSKWAEYTHSKPKYKGPYCNGINSLQETTDRIKGKLVCCAAGTHAYSCYNLGLLFSR